MFVSLDVSVVETKFRSTGTVERDLMGGLIQGIKPTLLSFF